MHQHFPYHFPCNSSPHYLPCNETIKSHAHRISGGAYVGVTVAPSVPLTAKTSDEFVFPAYLLSTRSKMMGSRIKWNQTLSNQIKEKDNLLGATE